MRLLRTVFLLRTNYVVFFLYICRHCAISISYVFYKLVKIELYRFQNKIS